MRHVLLVALATFCVGAAVAGSASAAHTTACSMVTAAEYKQVLGHPVRIRPGEGSSSCNVLVGGSFAHDIIPNLNPYNAAYIKRMLSTMPGKQRVASLGPVGYVVVGTDGSVTSYAEKRRMVHRLSRSEEGEPEQGAGDQARQHRPHAPLTVRGRTLAAPPGNNSWGRKASGL